MSVVGDAVGVLREANDERGSLFQVAAARWRGKEFPRAHFSHLAEVREAIVYPRKNRHRDLQQHCIGGVRLEGGSRGFLFKASVFE